MRLLYSAALALGLAFSVTASAVDKEKALFVGGSVGPLPAGTEGTLGTTDEESLLFVGERDLGVFKIPWKSILELEYGQDVKRSAKQLFVGKSRRHFLTIVFRDAQGREQSAVLELGKDLVRPALAAMEARSGRKVTYQDDEAVRFRK